MDSCDSTGRSRGYGGKLHIENAQLSMIIH